MYESPIKLIIDDMFDAVKEAADNQIVMRVQKEVDVDKDELIKALKHDRDQYDKGFRDAQPKWISVEERLPEIGEEVIVYIPGAGCQVMWLNQPDQETADIKWVMEHGWWCAVDEVTHWMQLPPPPEVEG